MGDFGKTFEQVAQMYVDHHSLYSRSRRTAESQVAVLTKAFAHRPFETIGREDVRRFVAERRMKGTSGATVNRNLAALSRMANLAQLPNPVKGFPRFRESQGRTRYLTEAEAQRLLDAASVHLQPVIFAALMTGGRLGELLALTWADIDLDAGILWFRSRTTKTQRERAVPISPALATALRTLGPRQPNDPVFHFHGRPLRSVRTSFERARKRAGLGKDVTMYVCRHSYASWAMMNGLDPYRLSRYMGHSGLGLVSRYAHLSPEYLKDGARFFGPPESR